MLCCHYAHLHAQQPSWRGWLRQCTVMSTPEITSRHQQSVQVTAEQLPNGRMLYAAIQDVRTSTSGALRLSSAGDLQALDSSFEPETGAAGHHQQSSSDGEARGAAKRMRRRSDAGQVRIHCAAAMPHVLHQAQRRCLPAHNPELHARDTASRQGPVPWRKALPQKSKPATCCKHSWVCFSKNSFHGIRAVILHDKLTDAPVSSQVVILPGTVCPGRCVSCRKQQAWTPLRQVGSRPAAAVVTAMP